MDKERVKELAGELYSLERDLIEQGELSQENRVHRYRLMGELMEAFLMFPFADSRRIFQRLPATGQVMLRVKDKEVHAQIIDISAGGLALQLITKEIALGQNVKVVTIDIGGIETSVGVEGIVVSLRSGKREMKRVGVQFDEQQVNEILPMIRAAYLQNLEKLIQE